MTAPMRRLFALFVALCAGCLVAATPRPTPRPPLPVPTVHLNFPSDKPTVLIYPFETASGLNPKVGTQVAGIFAHAMTQAGNITILPVPSGVTRSNFLTNAQAKKADYYITGYVTPIGDTASVVVQVVSVQSGVIAFSQTSQVSTINDATSLALTSHDAILQMSGTNVNVTTTESATAAPTAAATNGAQFSLGHLFSHHRTTTAVVVTAAPSTKPARGIILVAVRGATSVPASQLAHATQLLEHDLAAHFEVRGGGGRISASLSTAATSICGAQRDNTIATGELVEQHLGGLRPRTNSIFTLQIWTCFGDVLYKTTESNRDIARAISQSVAAYVIAHPNNS